MGISDPLAKASAQRLAKVNENTQVDNAIKEALKDKRAEEQFDRQLKKQTASDIARDARQERNLAVRLDQAEAAQARKDATQRAKDAELPKDINTKMAEITSARRAAVELMDTLSDPKVQKLFGPARGRLVDAKSAIGMLSEEDAKVVAKVRLQFANAVQTLGAGAFGYRISERPFILTFSEAMKNDVKQNIGNLEEWIGFFDRKEQGYRVAWPKADFTKFDKTRQEVADIAAKRGMTAPSHGGAATQKPRYENPDTGEVVEWDGKAWQKIKK
jgi:hypothetical protein